VNLDVPNWVGAIFRNIEGSFYAATSAVSTRGKAGFRAKKGDLKATL
jgi:hypothetical protein